MEIIGDRLTLWIITLLCVSNAPVLYASSTPRRIDRLFLHSHYTAVLYRWQVKLANFRQSLAACQVFADDILCSINFAQWESCAIQCMKTLEYEMIEILIVLIERRGFSNSQKLTCITCVNVFRNTLISMVVIIHVICCRWMHALHNPIDCPRGRVLT